MNFPRACAWLSDLRAVIAVVISAMVLLLGIGRGLGRIETRLDMLESGQQEIRGLLLGHIQTHRVAASTTRAVPSLVPQAWAQEGTNEVAKETP